MKAMKTSEINTAKAAGDKPQSYRQLELLPLVFVLIVVGQLIFANSNLYLFLVLIPSFVGTIWLLGWQSRRDINDSIIKVIDHNYRSGRHTSVRQEQQNRGTEEDAVGHRH